MHAATTLGLVVTAVVLAGCSGSGSPAASDRQWTANAAGLIDQLRSDVTLSSNGGADLTSAREALGDESDLYALLLAYSDFGGCTRMVGNVGEATRRLAPVERTLTSACGRLERAALLFTRSTTDNDPRALVAAGRQAERASPLLVRAALELARTSSAR